MLSVRDAVNKSFKAKSQRAIRLHSCESIFIIFAPSYVNSSRQNRFKCCNLHDLIYIFLDNGVMNTPKHRFLLFAFTVLCFKKDSNSVSYQCKFGFIQLHFINYTYTISIFLFGFLNSSDSCDTLSWFTRGSPSSEVPDGKADTSGRQNLCFSCSNNFL